MKLTRLALIPAAALLLSACTNDDAPTAVAPTESVAESAPATEAAPEAPATVTVTQEAPAPEPEPEPEPTEEPTEEPKPEPKEKPKKDPAGGEVSEGQATFGDTWVYDDGIEVSVAEGEKFEPSSTSAGGDGFDDYVKFTVTVTNNTGESFDPGSTYSTVQSGTSEGDQVFDSGADVGGGPSTTLLDGRSVNYDIAFGVDDPKDLVMEIRPSFDYDPAIFTN